MMRLVALVSLLAAHSASAFVLPATKVVGAPAKASAMRTFAVRVFVLLNVRVLSPVGRRGHL